MARITYFIHSPPAVAGAHTRYTAHELRCLAALFGIAWQPRSFRRWFRLRWWLLLSSARVIRHVRICTRRRYHTDQRSHVS
jgi:hypothetical protein